jgi:hypothetical protein
MQLISGMNKCSYWISNTIADIVKSYLPILCIMVIARLFDTNYQGVWVMMLLFPPAIVMFSYNFSFLFHSQTTAQITIFSMSFFVSGIMSLTVITLQIIPFTAKLGNSLRWWCCLVPSYCVTHAIIFSSSSELITQAQPNLNQHLWAFENLTGDALCLVAHFVFGMLLLLMLETNLLSDLGSCTIRRMPSR